MDTETAEVVGDWRESGDMQPYVGYNYLHDSQAGDPANYIRYRVALPKAGRYEVRVSYSAHHNRATNALYVVHHADGTAEHRVNQRKKPGELAPFISLGVYEFEKGTEGYMDVISTADAGGYVIADAAQWLAVE